MDGQQAAAQGSGSSWVGYLLGALLMVTGFVAGGYLSVQAVFGLMKDFRSGKGIEVPGEAVVSLKTGGEYKVLVQMKGRPPMDSEDPFCRAVARAVEVELVDVDRDVPLEIRDGWKTKFNTPGMVAIGKGTVNVGDPGEVRIRADLQQDRLSSRDEELGQLRDIRVALVKFDMGSLVKDVSWGGICILAGILAGLVVIIVTAVRSRKKPSAAETANPYQSIPPPGPSGPPQGTWQQQAPPRQR